jgi:hypothetical protein
MMSADCVEGSFLRVEKDKPLSLEPNAGEARENRPQMEEERAGLLVIELKLRGCGGH